MGETLTNDNPREITKIKTHHARIVVDGTAEKPYYSIEWYDHTKNEYFLGYSSYCIDYVFKWLEECFEIVEAPKTRAEHIRAMTDEELEEGIRRLIIGYEPWCDHHCKMNGDDDCNRCLRIWLQQPAEVVE